MRRTGPEAATPGVEWVAERWIDPDWFAHQRAPGDPPTSGAPAIVPLRRDDDRDRPSVPESSAPPRRRLLRATAPSRTGTRS